MGKLFIWYKALFSIYFSHSFSKTVEAHQKPCQLELSERKVSHFEIPLSEADQVIFKLSFLLSKFLKRQEDLAFSTLRSEQGIGAPLKLLMERKAASNVGRLPFLPSSNLMTEVLTGRIDSIGFEDIFNGKNLNCEEVS